MKWPIVFFAVSVPVFAGDADFEAMLDDLLEGTVPQISAAELSTKLKGEKSKRPVLLDARADDEFNISHLAGAKLVGFRDFSVDRLAELKRDQPVVVYCSVGKRSELIGEKLREAGFTDVKNLRGGIFQWANEKRGLVDSNGPTKTVHSYNRKWGKWLKEGVKKVR
ncbi:MAG: rhodanese-like domain-containing protein [Verrucomicrobiales bacterium]|nr:rhodanese-like domain-containing protein [Verrucomicrobiales bacterium]